MGEGTIPKRGGLSPEAQTLEAHAKAFVNRMLKASGYLEQIPYKHYETTAGYYLFEKARLQLTTAQQLIQSGHADLAASLQKSAMIHATLSLRFAPSVVEHAIGEIRDADVRYPFHRARLFGIRLADEELAVRGQAGYQRRMTPKLESKLGQLLQKGQSTPTKRRSVA